MVIQAVRAVWSEPRAAGAEGPRARDLALAAAIVAASCVETALRADLTWPVPSLAVAVVSAAALPWRRVHPLAVVAICVGAASAVQLAAIASDVRWAGLGTGAVFLLLPYALGRWASGREVLGGVGVFAAIIAITGLAGDPLGDVVGAAVVVLLAVAVGMGVRYQQLSAREKVDGIRSRERVALARELHDTIGHHVSAIAVQAQAGRALVASGVALSPDVLEVIEEQASRALEEMRSMLGALREGDRPDLAPQRGVHDIERFARSLGPGPEVTVELRGALDGLRSSVDAATYRIAGEAITNARRHARHATRVVVRVEGTGTGVRLTVDDDGVGAGSCAAPGFGLTGMAERASLLGGTFSAGPRPGGGWNVTAVLPDRGTPP